MQYKVSELEGARLDAAVARIEGLDVVYRDGQPAFEHRFDPDLHCHEMDMKAFKMWVHFKPSSCWEDGGPLVEREAIGISPVFFNEEFERKEIAEWEALSVRSGEVERGRTPLIAAMRCYVASKFGETIDLP